MANPPTAPPEASYPVKDLFMSALIAAHIPEVKRTTLTIPVNELRRNDVILSGMGIAEPVTVNKIFDPEFSVDVRCLTLINDRNSVYYRQYSAEMEVTIEQGISS